MAQLIDSKSQLSGKSELALFAIPPTQVAVQRAYYVDIQLQNPVSNAGPYIFNIPADPLFLDLNRQYIYMQLSIQRGDGANMVHGQAADAQGNDPNDPLVGPVNLIGKAFFRQVKLFLSSRLVYDSDDTYGLKVFLETELNFGEDAKKTQLQTCMYYKDITNDQNNAGLIRRAGYFQGSRIVELIAPLSTSLMNQERYLLNRTEVRLELYRNTDPFLLMCYANNPEYKIHVHAMKWIVRKVDLLKSTALGLEAALAKSAARYPIRRVTVMTRHIEGNRRECPQYTLYSGQLPRRMVIGLLDARAFHGDYARNPFRFEHFNIVSIQVTAGGVSYPEQPLTMDFGNNRYMRAYTQLFDGMGLMASDKGNYITYDEFGNGSTLFCFDMSADNSNGSEWELVREGAVTLEMRFSADTPATGIKVVLFSEMDNLVSIDRARNTYFDYSV